MSDQTGRSASFESDPVRISSSENKNSLNPQLSDFDIHLHAEGTHTCAYRFLGAHPARFNNMDGTRFAVWCPNADRINLIGSFNDWKAGAHTMSHQGDSGLWSIFVPEVTQGDLYKYEIRPRGDCAPISQRADPYAFAAELRPGSASKVWHLDDYTWSDEAWIEQRTSADWLHQPISIYEVHLGSWRRIPGEGDRWFTYRELADSLIPYVLKLGFTHVELMPVSEHPFDGSWGYQTLGYYAPSSRYGSPDDLKYFIDQCHRAGLGVIIDWVPAHFPKDDFGLRMFDGTHLYEYGDPRKGEHTDWGTLIFNYGRNEVRSFLISNAVYWADVFHIDGLRVDAVASMLYLDYSREPGEWAPNQHGGNENLEAIEFLKQFNIVIHRESPGILTFAEESTSWPMVTRPVYLGGLGFGLKWNMGWMNDTLQYFGKDPVHRRHHHNELTFSMVYAFTENFILPFSHDEVVHGKGSLLSRMPGDSWQQFANLRLLLAYLYAHPGKKLLFMGDEFAQRSEWNYDSSLDWHLLEFDSHRQVHELVRNLNRLYREVPSLHEEDFVQEGFRWIDAHDGGSSILSFLRIATGTSDHIACVFNLAPAPRVDYRIGVPGPGTYTEILNSDARIFGGSGLINETSIEADEQPWGEFPYSMAINLPPLAGAYFQSSPIIP